MLSHARCDSFQVHLFHTIRQSRGGKQEKKGGDTKENVALTILGPVLCSPYRPFKHRMV
jgi:hypothetical protein